MTALLDMTVDCALWGSEDRWNTLLSRVVDACAQDDAVRLPSREISLLLTDDASIRALNREWRGQDKATNVLSFPSIAATAQNAPDMPLGDIAVAFETAEREARDDGVSLEDHVAHLALHGILHLLDYNHETEKDADTMEAAERRVLAGLGIADPYAGRELVHATQDAAS